MEVTVRDHWRRRSRIPAPRPNGLRRSVGARAGRTVCERTGHRHRWPSLHASPPSDPAAVLCGVPQQRRVRRHGSVLPVGSRLPVPAPQAPGVEACLCASWRQQAPGVEACLCASWRQQAPGFDACLRALVLEVGTGNRRQERSSCRGFHGLRLHRHKHKRRRRGCVVLNGADRLRGDFHRVGRRRIDAVRGIGTRDQDRRDASQAPACLQRPGGEPRLRHGCHAHVAWCCPRRRSNVSGWQHWRCHGWGE